MATVITISSVIINKIHNIGDVATVGDVYFNTKHSLNDIRKSKWKLIEIASYIHTTQIPLHNKRFVHYLYGYIILLYILKAAEATNRIQWTCACFEHKEIATSSSKRYRLFKTESENETNREMKMGKKQHRKWFCH